MNIAFAGLNLLIVAGLALAQSSGDTTIAPKPSVPPATREVPVVRSALPDSADPATTNMSAPGTTGEAHVGALPVPMKIPPPSDGVQDLNFSDIFVTPHGPEGARYTDKALPLVGKKVRMIGYMVKRASYTPGQFLLTPLPIILHDVEMGACDDLPMATTWITMPRRGTMLHLPGPLVVIGTLTLETRSEADDRTSYVQLALEEITTLADLLNTAAASNTAKPEDAGKAGQDQVFKQVSNPASESASQLGAGTQTIDSSDPAVTKPIPTPAAVRPDQAPPK